MQSDQDSNDSTPNGNIGSQKAQGDKSLTPSSWISWMEKCFHMKNVDGPISEEATAYAMDGCARNPINLSGSYLGAAILRLASAAAGCQRGVPCEGTVFGLKPSSLLTVASVIVGLTTAISMPVLGAIIDNTPYRKEIGASSAVIIVLIMAISIAIGPNTWHFIYFLFIVEGYFSILHTTTVLAYLPGLTSDENQLATYTSLANIKQATVTFLFFALVTGITLGKKLTTVETARISSITVTINGFVFFAYSWIFLFKKKYPLRTKPENTNFLISGFKQLGSTSRKIFTTKTYRPLKYYILSLPWSPEAGSGTVQAILVTYMIVILQMTGLEIGVASFVLFVFQIPGGYLAKYLCQRFNALLSLQLSLVSFVLNSFLFPIVCSKSELKNISYLFAATWGISYGWMYPCQRVMYCTLSPKGQETELMGLFAFSNQILGWLPTIIFSALNEANVEMKWGVMVIGFSFIISFLFTLLIGNYENAVKDIASVQDTTVDEESGDDQGSVEKEDLDDIAQNDDVNNVECIKIEAE